jgi:hypothetical protein
MEVRLHNKSTFTAINILSLQVSFLYSQPQELAVLGKPGMRGKLLFYVFAYRNGPAEWIESLWVSGACLHQGAGNRDSGNWENLLP